MKLISLNTWGGRGGRENILKFFADNKDVDIFCLQEMWSGGYEMGGKLTGGVILDSIVHELLTEIGKLLPEHAVYFRPCYGDWYGLAIFIKKDFKVLDEGEKYVYKEKGYAHPADHGNHARTIQYITFETDKGPRTVVNFHGLWNGQGKTDTEDRLLQSDNIVSFLKTVSNPLVLTGDFNLRPDTVSVKKFEDFGLKNLIKEYGVTSTRTSLYTKSAEKFADYIFVSREVVVNDFKIMAEEVSDHAAMYLDFE